MSIKEIRFDSEKNRVSSATYLEEKKVDAGYIQCGIACGYHATTDIRFEVEGILLRLTAKGELTFFDGAGKQLAAICLPAGEEGRGCYQEVCCKVEDGCIWVRFPDYVWYDNYPNCDGESDRWDARIVGYKPAVRFCLATGTVSTETE